MSQRSSFSNKRSMLITAAVAGFAWAGLVGLIFLLNTAQYDFWFPGRILAYVLLLVAPALTFIPIGRMLDFSLYGYIAVLSWAGFVYTLAFLPTDPGRGWRENVGQLVLLLFFLFMVIFSTFLPVFYRLGFQLFSRRVEQYDIGRARRESGLAGLYVLIVAFLRIAGALNLLNAVALLLALVVLELLILSRNFGRS